ncbi:DsbA family protein [Candidatus Daviesbacteria bacterium]|nr:DsbA family protein [Candidatus Daviesbacteria bacterium]
MRSETKILGSILLFSLALIAGAVIILGRGSSNTVIESNTKSMEIDYAKGQKIGSDSAKVRLVEFSDFQCPACKAAEPAVKQVLVKYKDNLQFIYRHFPLPQHKNAKSAATLAEKAAESGKFWQMHDLLFETQESWSAAGDPTDFFLSLAARLELDQDQVKKALENRPFDGKINEDVADGQSLGVNSTPTFFINGKKLNLRNFTDLDKAVVDELNK